MTVDVPYYLSLADIDGRRRAELSEEGPLARPMGKQGWAVYNKATVPVRDEHDRLHLITWKRYRVLLEAQARIAADDCNTTLRAIAHKLGVAPQTVSNALRQFTAWGMIGTISSRGKYGGLTLFARSKGDGLERFARLAREAIRAFWDRRFVRRSNVHTWTDGVSNRVMTTSRSSSVDIRIRDDRIEAILEGQRTGAYKRVPCPAHEGTGRNLSFWRREDGSLGVKCWSHQCEPHAIKDAIEPWG